MKTFWQIFFGNKISEIIWFLKRLPIWIAWGIGWTIIIMFAFTVLILFIIYCGWAVNATTGILIRAGGKTVLDWYVATGMFYLFFSLLSFFLFTVFAVWLSDNYERAILEYENQNK